MVGLVLRSVVVPGLPHREIVQECNHSLPLDQKTLEQNH